MEEAFKCEKSANLQEVAYSYFFEAKPMEFKVNPAGNYLTTDSAVLH